MKVQVTLEPAATACPRNGSASLLARQTVTQRSSIGVVLILASHLAVSSTFSNPTARKKGNYLHFQLGLALAFLGTASSFTANHLDAFTVYPFLANDLVAMSALYTHHQYIAGFLLCGGFAHGAIFLVRDAEATGWVLLLIRNRAFILSHLSAITLFLGFHTLGLYVHNDVMQAVGTPEKQIAVLPVFAAWLQSAHAGHLGSTLSAGDFLVHHAIALGLHVTVLILLKAALNSRSSKLMPDKASFGYGFPCDGPGRGGTCDISAFDGLYLAVFWMLNTVGWITFYWHWKHLALVSDKRDGSLYLMGWLRDYLWLNSTQLINGYAPTGVNAFAIWDWMFLFGHLIWATGFMFLISWRGYWFGHHTKDKPVALSIVQARFVGLAHFSIGYVLTYGPFVLASSIAIGS